jgi:hypothetical protein
MDAALCRPLRVKTGYRRSCDLRPAPISRTIGAKPIFAGLTDQRLVDSAGKKLVNSGVPTRTPRSGITAAATRGEGVDRDREGAGRDQAAHRRANRGIARDLAVPAMAIGSNPLSSTRKSPQACAGSLQPCAVAARVANKAVSISQVFSAFLSVLETHIQMIGEGQQSLAEFPCVRTALSLGRLLDAGNRRDWLAVIGEHSGFTLGGGSRELGEMGLGFPNTNRLHVCLSIPEAPEHESPRSQSAGLSSFRLYPYRPSVR